MPCLSLEGPLERGATEPVDLLSPPGEDPNQAARLRCKAGTPSRAAASAGGQDLMSQHLLHPPYAVEAGAIAPPDGLPASPDGAALVDSGEKTKVVRPHEKDAVPGQPHLVLGGEVRRQTGGRLGRGHRSSPHRS